MSYIHLNNNSPIIRSNGFYLRLTLVFGKCFVGFENIEIIDFTIHVVNDGKPCEVINKCNELLVTNY